MPNNIDYCEACEDLKNLNPSLIANGFSNSNCTHLRNNEGLTGSNDDCEDLNTLNDCLIGSKVDEVELKDICDWKDFMKGYIPNVWTVLKALICSICGLWDKLDQGYTLTKSGNKITLNGPDGNHGTVTDTDTWQRNTSTQNGYVVKGEDDPLKVWCTNADGIPDWRNSPTLGGSLTLYDHDGAIGETKFWPSGSASSSGTIADRTDKKINTGMSLTAGKWVCCATLGYEENSTGYRSIGLAFGNDPFREGCTVAAAPSHDTILTKTYIHTVPSGETETVYLCARQNSGSTLDIIDNPETYVFCIRIC